MVQFAWKESTFRTVSWEADPETLALHQPNIHRVFPVGGVLISSTQDPERLRMLNKGVTPEEATDFLHTNFGENATVLAIENGNGLSDPEIAKQIDKTPESKRHAAKQLFGPVIHFAYNGDPVGPNQN